jgi:hypothetical protein
MAMIVSCGLTMGEVGAALGVRRTAEAADALTVTVGCVAPQGVVGPAERFASAGNHPGHPSQVLRLGLGHLKLPLHSLEVGPHLLGGKLVEAQLFPPAFEDRVRGAKARPGVDGGGTTDRATQGNRNDRVADAVAFTRPPVECAQGIGGSTGEFPPGAILALLQHHHGVPGLGQLLGNDGAGFEISDPPGWV